MRRFLDREPQKPTAVNDCTVEDGVFLNVFPYVTVFSPVLTPPAPPRAHHHRHSVPQKVRMLISALHFCFVRVHRESGSLPPGEVEGEPWYVIKDRILHVRETRTDDPEAELMVSFLMSSIELVSATRGSDVELELRLQVYLYVFARLMPFPGILFFFLPKICVTLF